MSKADKFIFRKTDTIGAADAEEDRVFLEKCFIDTGCVDVLRDCSDHRRIIIGRTGAGKTALLERLNAVEDRVIIINPESLSLAYITNSTILNFVSQLGVKLDIFFRLLWRHVFTVEIIKHYFNIQTEKDKRGFLSKIQDRFRDKKHQKALEYLDEWGEKFWEKTEYRIKEVTTKLEQGLEGAIGQQVPFSILQAKGKIDLTEEQKRDVIQRAQSVVNDVQIRQLSEILDLVNDILVDPQKRYYIIIDRLDEDWVEDAFRYRLIRALIETVKEFRKVENAKIIIAIRIDLLERVFALTRDSGFQEEKFESLYLNLRWERKQLIELLEKRINLLIRPQYTKQSVRHIDILPASINKQKAIDYIIERTMMRPRDIILFFNTCIQEAVNRTNITSQMIRNAEGEYSRLRLRSLFDEWFADYPNLIYFVDILKSRKKSFGLKDIDTKTIEELCLSFIIKGVKSSDRLSCDAKDVVEERLNPADFRKTLISILYLVGVVGLKLGSYLKSEWTISGRRSISSVEISEDTTVSVHPMFWRVLGISLSDEG